MNTWLIASNLRTYDSIGAFTQLKEVYWNEKQVQFNNGDIVYIYIAAPISAIGIKCLVTETGVSDPDIDDSEYWIDKDDYDKSIKECTWMRLRCLTIFDKSQLHKLKGKALKDHGLSSSYVLSRQLANDELLDYLKSVEPGLN